ncbi:MAG: hypothetical protein AB2A00_30680 [Myxococcota bacterium]
MTVRVLVTLLLTTLLTACTQPQPDPKTITTRVRLSPSCGYSCIGYDLDCVVALQARVLTADGVEPENGRRCQPITLGNLCDLTERNLILVDNVDIEKPLMLELRGLHNRARSSNLSAASLCEVASSSDWLFWGESPLTYLGDGGVSELVVQLECREGCPCSELGSSRCPVRFPPSACLATQCTQECATDNDCFAGALQCSPDDGKCVVEPGGFCDECSETDPCNTGNLCVAGVLSDKGVCAPPCPDTPCIAPATCVPLLTKRVLDGGAP